MIDLSICGFVEQDPARVGGAWSFAVRACPLPRCSRTSRAGVTVAEFVEMFPGATVPKTIANHALHQKGRSTMPSAEQRC